jgi:hypothetical protein
MKIKPVNASLARRLLGHLALPHEMVQQTLVHLVHDAP